MLYIPGCRSIDRSCATVTDLASDLPVRCALDIAGVALCDGQLRFRDRHSDELPIADCRLPIAEAALQLM
jgi:hypothetical protein